jgi:hypothetical protein
LRETFKDFMKPLPALTPAALEHDMNNLQSHAGLGFVQILPN